MMHRYTRSLVVICCFASAVPAIAQGLLDGEGLGGLFDPDRLARSEALTSCFNQIETQADVRECIGVSVPLCLTEIPAPGEAEELGCLFEEAKNWAAFPMLGAMQGTAAPLDGQAPELPEAQMMANLMELRAWRFRIIDACGPDPSEMMDATATNKEALVCWSEASIVQSLDFYERPLK